MAFRPIQCCFGVILLSIAWLSVFADGLSAQIQDAENFAEIQVWFVVDDKGDLIRLQNPWNRGPFLVAAELISDPEFVETAMKLSQDENFKLNRYLIVLLGFETVIQQPSLVPELKLTDQQQNELLAAIREERTASRKRAAEYHTQLVEDIETILTEPQRQEFKRLYRDDVMNLHVLWELQLAQLDLEQDSSLL